MNIPENEGIVFDHIFDEILRQNTERPWDLLWKRQPEYGSI